MLISVDLVGSTTYKLSHGQRQPDRSEDWAYWLRQFYESFPHTLARQFEALPDDVRRVYDGTVEPPTLWKYNGDEILFETVLTDHRQTAPQLTALRAAVMEFGAAEHSVRFPMDLKSTAWLAGFPVTNVEYPGPGQREGGARDFVGPQIDLGFRLSQHATRRRMVLDVLLAEMLCTALEGAPPTQSIVQFGYGGRQDLRGVPAAATYPVVWLDVPDPRTEDEEALLGTGRQEGCTIERLHRFLRNYIAEADGLRRPFIDGDNRYAFDPVHHQDLERLRTSLRSAFRDEAAAADLADPAPEGRPSPPDGDIYEVP